MVVISLSDERHRSLQTVLSSIAMARPAPPPPLRLSLFLFVFIWFLTIWGPAGYALYASIFLLKLRIETEEKIQYSQHTEPENTVTVSPQEPRKTSLEIHETRKYGLSNATRPEKPAQNSMRPENTGSVTPQDQKKSSEFYETRKYWLSISTRPEKPAQNSMRSENTDSVSPQDQKNQLRLP